MKTATSSKWPRRAALTVPFHLELCDAPQILSLSVYGCIAWLDPGTAPTAHAAEAREHLGRGHGAYRMLPLLLLQLMLQDATSTATCAAPAPAKPTPWADARNSMFLRFGLDRRANFTERVRESDLAATTQVDARQTANQSVLASAHQRTR